MHAHIDTSKYNTDLLLFVFVPQLYRLALLTANIWSYMFHVLVVSKPKIFTLDIHRYEHRHFISKTL